MTLDYISARGDIMPLVGNKLFTITNIDGMTQASTSLSSVVAGGVDGDRINSMQATPRTIILDLRIKGDANVEDAKREILRVIKLKQGATLKWTQNNKTVVIRGIVEAVDMPRWMNGITMQVTIHCEEPFWEDVDFVVQQIKEGIALHWFTQDDEMLFFPEYGIPFGEYDISRTRHIFNAGDVDVGMDIEVLAYKTATNPIIYDDNGNYFGIGYGAGGKRVTLHAGDIVKISTHRGRKAITLNGVSIIGKVKPLSTWLQLRAGDNIFSVQSEDADAENLTFAISYKQKFI